MWNMMSAWIKAVLVGIQKQLKRILSPLDKGGGWQKGIGIKSSNLQQKYAELAHRWNYSA